MREVDEVGWPPSSPQRRARGCNASSICPLPAPMTLRQSAMPRQTGHRATAQEVIHAHGHRPTGRLPGSSSRASGPLRPKAGRVAVFGKGDTRRRWVGVDDVAQIVVALAVEADPPEMVEFGGPRGTQPQRGDRGCGTDHRVHHEGQRMPRVVAKFGLRLLDRPNDALASIFGAGLHQDLVAADWDDVPFRVRGSPHDRPRNGLSNKLSASEWVLDPAQ